MQKFLDLTETRCPLTFVLAKRALLALDDQGSLRIQLSGDESVDDIRNYALRLQRNSRVLHAGALITLDVHPVTEG